MDAPALDMDAQVQGNVLETGNAGSGRAEDGGVEVGMIRHQVDEVTTKVDELEQRVTEVAQFYSSSSKKQLGSFKGSSIVKDREKEKQITSSKKHLDPTRREAASTKRMQELMRQFSTILRQITQHKWAWPFMQPVDVEGLGLHDYYEETRRKEEEAEANFDMQIAQEAANAKMARDISNELYELDLHLEELREMVVQKCRKMTTEEKRKLGSGLSRLSPEDLNKALEIIAQKNPSFQATAEEVDIDMDAQSESTLWRLKFFVKGALEAKSSASKNQDNKRKREICDAIAKNAKKRSKKLST
ncbi:transcription factor GTE6-like isoform X2 [Magnolia sinica]|uniref:transcription factor GTE6-like isoform X2 n=1 Tax=Magnolia sinica TaxID=86752 RepID=UPI0026595B4B|nr:transcription factor GTE6-like isoform X2 [Magnolia sinica]